MGYIGVILRLYRDNIREAIIYGGYVGVTFKHRQAFPVGLSSQDQEREQSEDLRQVWFRGLDGFSFFVFVV